MSEGKVTLPTFKWKFNTAQYGFLKSQKPEVFIYMGRGGGKTFAIGVDTFDCAMIGQTIQLLAAPTMDQLRGSTLKGVQECWKKNGIVEGYHYVINEKPKEEWGIDAFSKLSNNRIISFPNGSFIVCDTMENYDKHRGAQYDKQTVDEFQGVSPEARKVLLGCRRGSRMQELGLPIQIKYGLTPPTDVTAFLYFKDLVDKLSGTQYADFFQGSTYMNIKNLPDDYIEVQTMGMKDKDIQREVFGELVMDNAGSYCYAFDEEKHIKGVKLDDNEGLHLWMDFNLNIMATTVWQFTDNTCYCVDEFEPEKGMDIIKRCETIKSRYGNLLYGATITGDPATGATGLKKNLNYYTSIQSELELETEQFHVKKSHPDGKDAQVLVNSMFSRFPDLKIHPRCGNLIHDLKFCVTDEDGKLDKTNKTLTHYLDGMIYGFDYNFKGWYLRK